MNSLNYPKEAEMTVDDIQTTAFKNRKRSQTQPGGKRPPGKQFRIPSLNLNQQVVKTVIREQKDEALRKSKAST